METRQHGPQHLVGLEDPIGLIEQVIGEVHIRPPLPLGEGRGEGRLRQPIGFSKDSFPKLLPPSRLIENRIANPPQAGLALEGTTATVRTGVTVEAIPTQNVVAKIVGSDPALKKEVIVIGGHFDHVGHGYFGSRTAHWGRIHPGADDNASGTAVIMSIAEAMRQSGIKPRRTIVFMHFTGEERGLWGARYWADHPSVPIENVVAMLNLDMVGRNEPDIVSIGGDDNAAGLDALVKKLGSEKLQLVINNDASTVIDRSDNWAFALKDIPAIAFTGGGHDEYHAPADVSSLIVEDKIENIAKLTALVALEIAEHGLEDVDQGGTE